MSACNRFSTLLIYYKIRYNRIYEQNAIMNTVSDASAPVPPFVYEVLMWSEHGGLEEPMFMHL